MLYPQQNDIRNLLDLSGMWDFRLDPHETGETQSWFNGLQKPGAEPPRSIAVPASWNEQFQDTRDYMGMAWYSRTVYVPSAWHNERVFIRIGSANYAAKVWVNGKLLGTHEGGHLPFAFEITKHVQWEQPNTFVIQVENHLKMTRVPTGGSERAMMGPFGNSHPNTNFDFFPYAGIQRPVVLFSVPAAHIEDVTVTTDFTKTNGSHDGRVYVEMEATGATNGHVELSGANATVVCDLEFEGSTGRATLCVPDAKLWSPDSPHLYQLTVALTVDGMIIDRYLLEVGIRTVAVDGHQLLLNGEPITLTGFGKHEDFAITGRGLLPPLIVKDYSLLKWIGANSYRTAHYPYSEEEMMMADRHGILIIDEIPAVGLGFEDGDEAVAERLRICKQQMRELIARDKNHPSVIMWSVANEPFPPNMMQRFSGGEVPPLPDSTTDFFRQMFALTRELDETRLVTLVGIMGCPVEWLALSDVVMVNRYWGWYTNGGNIEAGKERLAQELDSLFEQLGKPMVVSEFGADTIAGHHADPPEMFSEEYQVEFLRAYLDVADARDFMIGMHVWNFADFKTAQATMRMGSMNLKGVFTRDRRPKMAAHFLRERWTR